MTLCELAKKLRDAGIDSAKSDTLRLAEEVSGLSRASLMARYNDEISGAEWYGRLSGMISRRASREPLQYIIGKWEFYGDEYKVTPDTLIPRPETEMLVDYAISHLSTHKGAHIADLCCGSGCIGIAVCRNTDAHCDSIDISSPALAVAKENANSLGVAEKITFFVGDVLTGTPLPEKRYDVILSNPPYIKTSDLLSLEPELSFEPASALDGGEDGMIFYRRIIENYKNALTMDGIFVFEIGADEGCDVAALAEKHGFQIEIHNDLAGLPRMAVLSKPN